MNSNHRVVFAAANQGQTACPDSATSGSRIQTAESAPFQGGSLRMDFSSGGQVMGLCVPRLPEEPKVPRLPENGSGEEEEEAAELVPEVRILGQDRISFETDSGYHVSGPPSLLLSLESPQTSGINSPPQVTSSAPTAERSMVRGVPGSSNSFGSLQEGPAHWDRPRGGRLDRRRGTRPHRGKALCVRQFEYCRDTLQYSIQCENALDFLESEIAEVNLEYEGILKDLLNIQDPMSRNDQLYFLYLEKWFRVAQAKCNAWMSLLDDVPLFKNTYEDIQHAHHDIFSSPDEYESRFLRPCDSRYAQWYKYMKQRINWRVVRLFKEITDKDVDHEPTRPDFTARDLADHRWEQLDQTCRVLTDLVAAIKAADYGIYNQVVCPIMNGFTDPRPDEWLEQEYCPRTI